MNEVKHTPGPWTAVIEDTDDYFPSVQIGPQMPYSDGSGIDTDTITVNRGQPAGTKFFANLMSVCNANAHLIAAAPELLDALNGLCLSLNLRHDSEPHLDTAKRIEAELGNAMANRYLTACLVLDKAQGRKPQAEKA